MNIKKIALFEGGKIRKVWDDKNEIWYFSVVDVVLILTDSPDPKDYWYRMKKREKLSGALEPQGDAAVESICQTRCLNEVVDIIHDVKNRMISRYIHDLPIRKDLMYLSLKLRPLERAPKVVDDPKTAPLQISAENRGILVG